MNHPLNTILYGPPGTGKTYATFERCVEICDQAGDELTRERIRSRYSELVGAGRVEFITFHQSYGYEEFVEGLRPETEGAGGGFRLAVHDGVIKRIAKKARSAPAPDTGAGKRRFFKVSLDDREVFKECMGDGVRAVQRAQRQGLFRSPLQHHGWQAFWVAAEEVTARGDLFDPAFPSPTFYVRDKIAFIRSAGLTHSPLHLVMDRRGVVIDAGGERRLLPLSAFLDDCTIAADPALPMAGAVTPVGSTGS